MDEDAVAGCGYFGRLCVVLMVSGWDAEQRLFIGALAWDGR